MKRQETSRRFKHLISQMRFERNSVPKSSKPKKTVLDKRLATPLQAGISAALRHVYNEAMEGSTAEFDALLARLR